MDDARLKETVQLKTRAGAELDVWDQPLAFRRVDLERTDRRDGGDEAGGAGSGRSLALPFSVLCSALRRATTSLP